MRAPRLPKTGGRRKHRQQDGNYSHPCWELTARAKRKVRPDKNQAWESDGCVDRETRNRLVSTGRRRDWRWGHIRHIGHGWTPLYHSKETQKTSG